MPRAAVHEASAAVLVDDAAGNGGGAAPVEVHHGHHVDDESRLRQLGYKQELVGCWLLLLLLLFSLVPRFGERVVVVAARLPSHALGPPFPSCCLQRRELNLMRNFAVSFGLLSMLTGLGGL